MGVDTGSPVTNDYPAEHNGYAGLIRWIEINLGDDHNHLINPDDVYRLMVLKQ